jgi:hydrogenase-4 component F
MILAGNAGAIAPGPLMLAMGTTSLLLAGVMLYRRRDIKRFFAYSSIEHMGIITFAFGVGGPVANFAGLLHMALHSITKSAIFFAVGHIAQVKGSQKFADLGGLTATHPWLGWGFVAGVVAIAGLPPLGLFMSEFLVITAAMARQPWLAIPLVVGLAIGFAALVMRLQEVAFGEARGASAPVKASLVPLYLHLAMVLVAGVFLPAPLVAWFQSVAAMLGG